MNGMLVVDGDMHLRDTDNDCYRKYLEAPHNNRAVIWPTDGFDRNKGGKLGKRDVDAPTQLKDMDVDGIDIAVLYPTSGLGIGKIYEPEYAVALCKAYNNWLHDYCQTDPNRLKGVAMLPLQDIDAAVRELHRAVTELGMVGGMIPTYCRSVNLGDRATTSRSTPSASSSTCRSARTPRAARPATVGRASQLPGHPHLLPRARADGRR